MANGIDWSKLYAQPQPTVGPPSGGIFEEGVQQPYSTMTYNMAGNQIVREHEKYQKGVEEDASTFWQTVSTGQDFYSFQKPKHDAEYFRKLWQSTAQEEGVEGITDARQSIIDRFNLTEDSETMKAMKPYLEGEGVDPNRPWRKIEKWGKRGKPAKMSNEWTETISEAVPGEMISPATSDTYFGADWMGAEGKAAEEIKRLGTEHGWDGAWEQGKHWEGKDYTAKDLLEMRDYELTNTLETPAEMWNPTTAKEHYQQMISGEIPVEGFDPALASGKIKATGPGDYTANAEALNSYLNQMGGENFTAGEFKTLMDTGKYPEGGLLRYDATTHTLPNPEAMPNILQQGAKPAQFGAGTPAETMFHPAEVLSPEVLAEPMQLSTQTPGLFKGVGDVGGMSQAAEIGAQAQTMGDMTALAEGAGVESAGMLGTMGPAAVAAMVVLALGYGAGKPNTTIGKVAKSFGKSFG